VPDVKGRQIETVSPRFAVTVPCSPALILMLQADCADDDVAARNESSSTTVLHRQVRINRTVSDLPALRDAG